MQIYMRPCFLLSHYLLSKLYLHILHEWIKRIKWLQPPQLFGLISPSLPYQYVIKMQTQTSVISGCIPDGINHLFVLGNETWIPVPEPCITRSGPYKSKQNIQRAMALTVTSTAGLYCCLTLTCREDRSYYLFYMRHWSTKMLSN